MSSFGKAAHISRVHRCFRPFLRGTVLVLLALVSMTVAWPPLSIAQGALLPLKIRVGVKAPDFALPSAGGRTVSLSDFAGHNVLIDFYRGYWCEYCMGELGEFVKNYADFKVLDVEILAISVDPPGKGRWVKEKLKAPFPILSDSTRAVMELYGTRSPKYHGRNGESINTPTLVLIDKTGTIRWIHQAADFRVRAPVMEDLEEARKLK